MKLVESIAVNSSYNIHYIQKQKSSQAADLVGCHKICPQSIAINVTESLYTYLNLGTLQVDVSHILLNVARPRSRPRCRAQSGVRTRNLILFLCEHVSMLVRQPGQSL